MPEQEKSPKVVKKKKKNFFQKNFLVIILFLLSVAAIVINEYDKKNTETIKVEVDQKLIKEPSIDSEQPIKIWVYNPESKLLEEKEVLIPRQQNLIEGDFINEIIQNSDFITENMKFLSAYTVTEDRKKTTIIKLNSDFIGLKSNEELYNGFSQSVINTINSNFPNANSITIQIDGETAIIQ